MVPINPSASPRQIRVAGSVFHRAENRSVGVRFAHYVPDPWQRLADGFAILMVCLLAGLPRPVLTAAATSLGLMAVPHLYRFRLGLSVLDDLPRLLVAGTVVPFVAVSVFNPELDVPQTVYFSLAMAASLVAFKTIVSVSLGIRRRRSPKILSRTLILGSGPIARQLSNNLKNMPEFGLLPVALVDREIEPAQPIPGVVTGKLDSNLPALIREHRATTVIIAFGSFSDGDLRKALRSCVREAAELYIVPRLPEYLDRDNRTEMIGALPLRRVARAAHRSLTWFLKRPFDILVSGVALVLLSPVLLALALMVKINHRTAPVLFRQERIGMDGKPFELLKFRTMTPADPGESDSRWNIAGDARLTRLGATMRRFSLDELPQIYNVFRGDMALVGPRPERPYFVEKFSQEFPDYPERHRVPVGLTGWAAINGLRGDTSIRDRALYDNFYIENWSPWLDLKILLLTFRAVVGGSGG